MFKQFFTRKFAEEIVTSSVKLAVAGEVAKGLQKGMSTVLTKAATLAGVRQVEDEYEEVSFDEEVFDQD